MSSATFLSLDPIKGGSKDSEHEDWSDVLGFEFKVDRSLDSSESQSGTLGRPVFDIVYVRKYSDKGSVDIFKHCMENKLIDTAKIEVWGEVEGGDRILYHAFELGKARVASINTIVDSATQERPIEIVGLKFNTCMCKNDVDEATYDLDTYGMS